MMVLRLDKVWLGLWLSIGNNQQLRTSILEHHLMNNIKGFNLHLTALRGLDVLSCPWYGENCTEYVAGLDGSICFAKLCAISVAIEEKLIELWQRSRAWIWFQWQAQW